MEFTKKRIVTIVVVAAVIASALFVIYDFNGKSLDLSGRTTRIVLTDSMDGDIHPDYCMVCETCGYTHFAEYHKASKKYVDLYCENPDCADKGNKLTVKEPCSYSISKIPTNSLIMVKTLNESQKQDLKIGDVISFYSDSNRLQTIHRITAYAYDGSGNLVGYHTRGDNTSGPDDTSTAYFEKIEGEVVGVSPILGQIVHTIQGSSVIFLIMIVVILGVMVSVLRDMFKIRKSEDSTQPVSDGAELSEDNSEEQEHP